MDMTKNPTFHTRVAMTLFLLILTILAPTSKAWAVDVKYINKDGVENDLNATQLNGSNSATTLSGVYFVNSNTTANYLDKITLDGDVTIILCDGATLNIGTNQNPLSGPCINGGNNSLTIYGQTNQTGTINIYCSSSSHISLGGSYNQYGGNVNLNGTSDGYGITLSGDSKTHTLTRGSLTINNGTGASAAINLSGNNSHINISGGTLTTTNPHVVTAITISESTSSINMSGGVLTVTGSNSGIQGNVNMSGGVLTATSESCGIWGNVNMSGGVLTTTGTTSCGIRGDVTSMSGGVLTAEGNQGIAGHVTSMSGGFLTATGTNKKGIEGPVNFTGGNFKATGSSDYAGISGNVTLNWSSCYDSFTANRCTVSIANGKSFLDGGIPVSGNNIAIDGTTTLTPDNRGDFASSTRIDLEVHDDGTGNYWTTFYHPAVGFNISANENGVPTAYIATVSGSKVELTGIEPIGCIPAGQAVIVKTATYGNGKITLTRSDGIAQPSGTNHLKGGASVTPGLDAYTLSRGDGGTGTLGFYKFSFVDLTNPTQTKSLNPYKAHLEIDPSSFSPARGFIGIDDDETTGILTPPLTPPLIEAGSSEAAWYSLDGRRLSGKPVKKGVYVRNGQKYIVK